MLTIHTPTNIALQENEVYVRSEADNFQDEWPVHTHNGYEIHYFIQGDATFLIGDRIYKPLPGDMFIFRGGVPHRINPSREMVYKRSFVNFTELLLLDMLAVSQLENLMSIFRHPNGLLVHCLRRSVSISQLYLRESRRRWGQEIQGTKQWSN